MKLLWPAAIALSLLWSAPARSQCDITELAKLVAGDGAANDHLGYSVAMTGGKAAVGAYQDDYGVWTDSGSVYLYDYVGSVWTYSGKLVPSAPGNSLWFGISVAMDQDVLAVGAPGVGAGSVYVYRHDGTRWVFEAILVASDGAAGDSFGGAVSVNQGRILVGAYGDDDSGSSSGSAYVFHDDGAGWTQEAKIKASTGLANDQFGANLALNGSLAIVGCMNKMSYRGVAYVFRHVGASWRQEQILLASDGEGWDYFGASVAVLNDATYGDIAMVGAPHEDQLGDDSGAVYIFRFDGTRWVQDQKLQAAGEVAYDYFGWSLAANEDVLAIGSIFYDDDRGSVFLYKNDGASYVPFLRLRGSDGPTGSHFGHEVALGPTFVITGAAYDDPRGAFSGSAYVFAARTDLSLKPSALIAHAGDTLSFTTSFGYPGDAVGLALVEANGVPMFRLLTYGAFAFPTFKWTISGMVPPGLAGLEATFQSFGMTMCGRGDDSNRVEVSFR